MRVAWAYLIASVVLIAGCSPTVDQDGQSDALALASSDATAGREPAAAVETQPPTEPVFATPAMSAETPETRLMRYPDIHGERIVFVYAGDIWTTTVTSGVAYRLTSHAGLELFPKFSPDGNWIAFTGQYDGDEQVYVIPASGGEPRRLTHYPARGPLPLRWGYDNQVNGWTPDSQSVIFRTHRDHFNLSQSRLYSVALDGSSPEPLAMALAGAGVLSPDGEQALFSPIARDFRTWKRYQGGWAQDLWIMDFATGESRNVTSDIRSDRDPVWNSQGMFFVSDRDDHLNLYALSPDGEARQLTTHEGDVRWASGDAAGSIIYELDGRLHVYSTIDETDRALTIDAIDDGRYRRERERGVSEYIEDFRLSPNGERVAVTARGDVFSMPVGDGVVRNLTRSSGAHDRVASWSPDGSTLAYVSDASGEEEIWLITANGSGTPRQVTHGNETRFFTIAWSPNGDQLAITDEDGRIFVVSLETGALTPAGESHAWYMTDLTWSPDGRYLAYTALEPTQQGALHIRDVEAGTDIRVTDGMFNTFNPVWAPSGEHLYFLSDREFSPQIGSVEWNYSVDRETGIYALALTADAPNPFAPRNVEAAEAADDTSSGAEIDTNSETTSQTVQIDFDGLADRVIRVPVPADNYGALSVFDDRLLVLRFGPFYLGRGTDTATSLMAFSFEDREMSVVAPTTASGFVSTDTGQSVQAYYTSGDGSSVLVRQNSGFRVVSGGEPTAVDMSRLRARIDPVEEWHAVLDEVWRRYRDDLYAPNMHGYDWVAIRDQYRPLVAQAGHRSDVNFIIGEMIGELDVGHAYISGGDESLPDRPPSVLLGARFERDEASGRYRIAQIFEGDNAEDRYRSPLTEIGVNVSEGDYLLAINGEDVGGSDTPYQVLRRIGGGTLELLVNDSAQTDGARRVLVSPISSENNLLYLDWINANRRAVADMSDGRVGYLHIPNMGGDGIREFIKWYYGQIRMDGLVVDVRGNNGGNVSRMILERLTRPLNATGHIEGMTYPTTYPWGANWPVFTGEMAVLASENTLSDGDAFTWSFRESGRGPVIGQRTWGGVIGIGNTGPLIDGGQVFVPQFAFADTQGDWAVEGVGVEPDIEIQNDPGLSGPDNDAQLQRAVDEILAAIGDRRPGQLPDRPEPPVRAQ